MLFLFISGGWAKCIREGGQLYCPADSDLVVVFWEFLSRSWYRKSFIHQRQPKYFCHQKQNGHLLIAQSGTLPSVRVDAKARAAGIWLPNLEREKTWIPVSFPGCLEEAGQWSGVNTGSHTWGAGLKAWLCSYLAVFLSEVLNLQGSSVTWGDSTL